MRGFGCHDVGLGIDLFTRSLILFHRFLNVGEDQIARLSSCGGFIMYT